MIQNKSKDHKHDDEEGKKRGWDVAQNHRVMVWGRNEPCLHFQSDVAISSWSLDLVARSFGIPLQDSLIRNFFERWIALMALWHYESRYQKIPSIARVAFVRRRRGDHHHHHQRSRWSSILSQNEEKSSSTFFRSRRFTGHPPEEDDSITDVASKFPIQSLIASFKLDRGRNDDSNPPAKLVDSWQGKIKRPYNRLGSNV